MSLSSREVALAIIPKITGGLSMMGSGYIVFQVVSNSIKRHHTYHRLLACMSLCDFFSSFCYFLSTWPIPPGENVGWGSPAHYAAVGNEQFCTFQGFGIQFGVTTAIFNVMLSVHYLLVIKFNHKEKGIRRKEPFMLGFALLAGLGLSVPGLFLRMYNNSNLWCWISPNWNHCEEEGRDRDECVSRTYNLRWAFYYGPLWACIASVVAAQICLWNTVRQMEVKASRWRMATTDSKVKFMEQSKKVAIQSALYVAGFIVTWTPYTAIAMTGRYFTPNDVGGFAVLLMVVICQPSQGFLNVFIYHRRTIVRSSANILKSVGQHLNKSRFGLQSENKGTHESNSPKNSVIQNDNDNNQLPLSVDPEGQKKSSNSPLGDFDPDNDRDEEDLHDIYGHYDDNFTRHTKHHVPV